ncbi:phosphotransferase, partial [Streptomyces aurantiogriseus]
REEYAPGSRPGGEAEARLWLRYRLSAATADAYARGLHGGRAGRGPGRAPDGVRGDGPHPPAVRRRPGTGRRGGDGPRGAQGEDGPRHRLDGRDLDAELPTRTPRIGLWPATTELTVGETVEAIPEKRERARVA